MTLFGFTMTDADPFRSSKYELEKDAYDVGCKECGVVALTGVLIAEVVEAVGVLLDQRLVELVWSKNAMASKSFNMSKLSMP